MIRLPHKLLWTALAIALLAGTGFCEDAGRGEEDERLVLGEEDLAERGEMARNTFRRITPGDEPLVQDVGTWPVAWEEFAPNWAAAVVGREYGAWVVPFSLVQESGATVIRDANDTVLWRGETDFAKPESASVTLVGGLVAEEDWAAYEGVRDWVETNASQDMPSPDAMPPRTTTNGLRFTSVEVGTNGTVELSLAWEEDGDVDIFAYLLSGIPSTNVVTWTNDENQVVTTTNTVWEIIGENLSGFDNAWEWRGMASVTNGEGIFTDSGAAANPVRMGFYAAAEANDTDGDGLNDGVESFVHHTDPENPDTDGDGEVDGTDPYPATSNVFWVVTTTNEYDYQHYIGSQYDWTNVPDEPIADFNVIGFPPTADSVVTNVCVTGYVDDNIKVDGSEVDWGYGPKTFTARSITNEIFDLQSGAFILSLYDLPALNHHGANEVRLGDTNGNPFRVEWTWKVPVCVTGADFICVGNTAQMGVSWEDGGPYSWNITGSAASINPNGLLTAVTTGVATVTAGNAAGFSVSKEVAVVQVAFLNASNCPVNALKIGKWENAFDATNAVKDDFIDLDPDRFRIQLVDPGRSGAESVVVALSTEFIDTTYCDDNSEIDLVEQPANSGIFVSTNLLLTADAVDDSFTNPEVPSEASRNDRTHKTALGGTVRVRYPATGYDEPCTNGIPVNVEGTCHVIPVILRDKTASEGGEAVVPVAKVEMAMKAACERYAQVGVKLTWDTPLVCDPPSGVDLNNGLMVRTNLLAKVLTDEAKAAIVGVRTLGNSTNIHLIYVNALHAGTATLSGSSVADYWYDDSEDPYLYNVFLKANDTVERAGFTIAHELGHLLRNAGHEMDATWKLMYGEITSTDVTGQRRFTAGDEATIRGNIHVH